MVGNSGHLASALGARALLWLFPEWRANSPSALVSLLYSESVLTESHLLGDLASKTLWSWGCGGDRGWEGGAGWRSGRIARW